MVCDGPVTRQPLNELTGPVAAWTSAPEPLCDEFRLAIFANYLH